MKIDYKDIHDSPLNILLQNLVPEIFTDSSMVRPFVQTLDAKLILIVHCATVIHLALY